MAVTATEARRNLFPSIQKINEDRAPVEITSRHGDAVLMSRADHDALEETAHLLRADHVCRYGAHMRRVIAVRHAMPVLDPSLSPAEWPLSEGGVTAARGLFGSLPTDAFAVVSNELKARETLRLALGCSVHIDERFGEVRRPAERVGEDVRPRRGAWVAGRLDERHLDWETPAQAAERFEQGVRAAPPGDVLIGTHGMCLTAWLVSRAQVEAGEAAVDFWQSLTFPDVITVPRWCT